MGTGGSNCGVTGLNLAQKVNSAGKLCKQRYRFSAGKGWKPSVKHSFPTTPSKDLQLASYFEQMEDICHT